MPKKEKREKEMKAINVMEIYWILNELSIMFPTMYDNKTLCGRGGTKSFRNILIEYENPHLARKLIFNLMLEQRVNHMWLDYSLKYVGKGMEWKILLVEKFCWSDDGCENDWKNKLNILRSFS